MAGQLTGRSRFGFKIVWIAVQCCALHLNDLKGYRTLALPTSSRETRAELEKMTVKVLKEKLREKGKKVSGRKAELIARLTQQDLQGPTETQAKAVWVQQLREDYGACGDPFKITGNFSDIGDLKEALVKKMNLSIVASLMDICTRDSRWLEDTGTPLRRGASKSDCYGFIFSEEFVPRLRVWEE
eukprot:symbB.v1.2.035443.t1/scaffold4763.1/size41558/1